jgi:RNA 2',3'-cyclic 3'-phosphodiesterase
MRIFLAVFPPPAAQQLAADVIDALRQPGDGVSWVKKEHLHYTLRFLGEIGDDGARRAGEAAREAAAACAAFDVALGTCGAFPTGPGARVLWIGLARGADPFVALEDRLEKALAHRGWAPDPRGFTPHLTLGRVREPGRDWSEPLAGVGSLDHRALASFRVDRIRVVRSELHPHGSIYHTVSEAALSGAIAGG